MERLRKQGEAQFAGVSADLEARLVSPANCYLLIVTCQLLPAAAMSPARCRSYVEYAAEQCQARVNSLVEALTEQGRTILTEVMNGLYNCKSLLCSMVNEQTCSRFTWLFVRSFVRSSPCPKYL